MYSTWNSAQCYVAARLGGEFGVECICMAESLWRPPETVTTLLAGYAAAAAAAAKSLQPHRWQPTRLPIPGILQARTLEWVAISFSSA